MVNLGEMIQSIINNIYSKFVSGLSPEVYFNILEKLILTVVILVVGYLIAKKLSKVVDKSSKGNLEEHRKSILTKITYYGVMFLAVFIVIRSVLGTSLSGFFAAAGITGIVLGLAAQKSMSNLISGIFLFVDRSFEIGDMVEVSGHTGYVREITLLSTRIVKFDNTLVKIPNERMFSEDVRNDSKFGIRRMDLDIGISYGSSIDQARKIILDILNEEDRVLDGPEPTVVVKELDDSAVVLQARPWIDPKDWKVKFDLIEKIKKNLTKEGVEIPFPHHTVYLRGESKNLDVEKGKKSDLEIRDNNFNEDEDKSESKENQS